MKVSDNESLVDLLCKQIQARILSGEYPPGHKLRQGALASQFRVSRTPVRAALSLLAAKDLIIHHPEGGAIIKARSPREVREFYRVRAEVEGLAAELAAQWIPDHRLELLHSVHDRFVRAVRALNDCRSGQVGHNEHDETVRAAREEWINSNAEYHSIIYEASNNACLQRVINDLHMSHTRSVQASSALAMYRHRMENNIWHHQAILSALERRDPLEARGAMTRHIVESGEFVADWLENQSR